MAKIKYDSKGAGMGKKIKALAQKSTTPQRIGVLGVIVGGIMWGSIKKAKQKRQERRKKRQERRSKKSNN